MNNDLRAGKRILQAMKDGWLFGMFEKADDETSRHSFWASDSKDRPPDNELYYRCHKVDGAEEDWINALLDEAGIPDVGEEK